MDLGVPMSNEEELKTEKKKKKGMRKGKGRHYKSHLIVFLELKNTSLQTEELCGMLGTSEVEKNNHRPTMVKC